MPDDSSGAALGGCRCTALLHVFPTFAVGGAQVRFAMWANRSGGAYRHTVVALDGRRGCIEKLLPSVPIAVENSPVDKAAGLPRRLSAMRSYLTVSRAEVLVTYNWGSIEWAIANILGPKLPHVHIEDGFGPEEADRQFARRVWTRRLVLGRAEIVVVPSQRLATIATNLWRVRSERLRYVANGIDMRRFTAPAEPSPFGEGETVVGTIAPLRREKRVDRLIEAFARLDPAAQNVRLVIGGDGPERPALEERAAALGIGSRTTFVGHVLKPELLLPHFDLFAITSDTEQMPFGVIEAMAAGLPVVATDVGDIRLMLARSNDPYVVERDDPGRLVAALRHLTASPALREEIGIENRKRASAEFELERMSAAYDAIFQSAGSRGAGRADSPASVAGQAR